MRALKSVARAAVLLATAPVWIALALMSPFAFRDEKRGKS